MDDKKISTQISSTKTLNSELATNLIIEKARFVVQKLTEKRGNGEPPFLSEDFAQLFGVKEIVKADLGETSGLLLRFEDGYVIKVNRKHSLTRQNFSCAHEIGHILFTGLKLERYIQTTEYRTYNPQRESKLRYKVREHLCDVVASELLMPEMVFGKYLTKYGLSVDTVEVLAKLFKVSFTTTAIRMAEVSQQPCIAVLWKSGLNEKSNTLSVSWSIGPRKTTSSTIRFVPVKKQVDQTSSQYKAFTSDDVFVSHQSFKHGNVSKICRVESKGFGYDENKYVISLAFPAVTNS